MDDKSLEILNTGKEIKIDLEIKIMFVIIANVIFFMH